VRILKELASFRTSEEKGRDIGINAGSAAVAEIAEKATESGRIDGGMGGSNVEREANMREGSMALAGE
jgi:hypothetical protein